jgi:hypothetical protein
MKLSFEIGVWNPCRPFPCRELARVASSTRRTYRSYYVIRANGVVRAPTHDLINTLHDLLLDDDPRPGTPLHQHNSTTSKGTTITEPTHPSAINMKSANPCTITLRTLFSITFGKTVNAGGKLLSPSGNTFTFEHSAHSVSMGAWMASLTSFRSK